MVDLLSDYVDGELTPKLQHQLEIHLEGCVTCAAFLQTFKQTQAQARSIIYEDMPTELRQRLHRYLRQQASESSSTR
jgi:anti-sigma factor RsiW